ncbi:MAG: hypothetical protein RMJ31_01485 [Nitrososphaerota archaeon]|nr:hypothetical protein [Nitrososphaerales archaeon]MCX8191902.1 hypothetical protein [Nitrososphaerales archaeon]MDW8044434.1 hypothetical protein [Nitrososphaerota archaeon]
MRLPSNKEVKPPVYTIEECIQCGLKSKRLFQEGDYVYKRSGQCGKCNGTMMITYIYTEKPLTTE